MISDSLVTAAAEVLGLHQFIPGSDRCTCGETPENHTRHRAEAVLAIAWDEFEMIRQTTSDYDHGHHHGTLTAEKFIEAHHRYKRVLTDLVNAWENKADPLTTGEAYQRRIDELLARAKEYLGG